jgi:hypothetical protein
MIMRDDDRGGVVLQGQLDDLPRRHAGAVDGAAKQLLVFDEAVTLV